MEAVDGDGQGAVTYYDLLPPFLEQEGVIEIGI